VVVVHVKRKEGERNAIRSPEHPPQQKFTKKAKLVLDSMAAQQRWNFEVCSCILPRVVIVTGLGKFQNSGSCVLQTSCAGADAAEAGATAAEPGASAADVEAAEEKRV
jgi:hypothetical protein